MSNPAITTLKTSEISGLACLANAEACRHNAEVCRAISLGDPGAAYKERQSRDWWRSIASRLVDALDSPEGDHELDGVE